MVSIPDISGISCYIISFCNNILTVRDTRINRLWQATVDHTFTKTNGVKSVFMDPHLAVMSVDLTVLWAVRIHPIRSMLYRLGVYCARHYNLNIKA